MTRDYDLVLFGATGFTGKLVADYLSRSADRPRWAIAGRNAAKLEALGLGVPVLVADAHDPAALARLAAQTTVVCTTVGPYTRHGSDLVAACVGAGTHYCDLAGEVAWMREMIDAHHEHAARTGARIVHTCGVDSIPSDLGTWALQREMIAAYGVPARKVTAVYVVWKGGLSGGTAASAIETARSAEVREARRVLGNPYGLDPDPTASRPAAPDERSITWDRTLKMFLAPFMMAQVNTRVVRRSHALAGLPWGDDFVYREVMGTPGTARGLLRAVTTTGTLAAAALAFSRPALRERLALRMPQPGDGPPAERRERGRWKIRFIGERGDHRLEYVVADDHGDPGYISSARMLGEAALCLANDPLTSPGGVLTPSVAMGASLIDRLRRAGLTFELAG